MRTIVEQVDPSPESHSARQALWERPAESGQRLGLPVEGVSAEALAELREKSPEGLRDLLREELAAKRPRFFLPVTRREAREREAARARRLELLRAISSQGAPEFVPLLVEFAGDWDPVIGGAAIKGLEKIPGEEARNALALLVEHRDKRVRRAAVAALAERREPENLALFLRLLEQRDREIQRSAALGLGQIDCKEAREALAERFRWAVDTGSPVFTRWINVLLPFLVTGMGAWAYVDPSLEWTVPRLGVLLLAGMYILARQRRKADRRCLAQSLAAHCKSEVPEEVVTLLPELEAVQTGFWQSDGSTVAAVDRMTRAAKEQIEERGNLPVAVDQVEEGRVDELPLASKPPAA